jgi:5'-nucleotidase
MTTDSPAPLYVLTNDDGIDAPGLAAMKTALLSVRPQARAVIVAPMADASGTGHRVTTKGPLALHPRGEDTWALAGTPADCVRIALHGLHLKADGVLAGINPGGNLGTDLYHSGTAAAAREAAQLGAPAIAISHYLRKGVALDWAQATAYAADVLRVLLGETPPAGAFWNVNLPHLDPGSAPPPWARVPVDPSPHPVAFTRDEAGAFRYSGVYHLRPRRDAHDVERCMAGWVSISAVI